MDAFCLCSVLLLSNPAPNLNAIRNTRSFFFLVYRHEYFTSFYWHCLVFKVEMSTLHPLISFKVVDSGQLYQSIRKRIWTDGLLSCYVPPVLIDSDDKQFTVHSIINIQSLRNELNSFHIVSSVQLRTPRILRTPINVSWKHHPVDSK